MGELVVMVTDPAEQISVMAHEVRLQLLALILESPQEAVPPGVLLGPGMDEAEIRRHLVAMEEAGILARDPSDPRVTRYTATADALSRFAPLVAPARSLPGEHVDVSHHRLLDRITARLGADFQGVFGPETVNRYVTESYQLLAQRAVVRTHLPVLTEQFAAERLTALAMSKGRRPRAQIELLFVCVHNAGRSQIAAALARMIGGAGVRVRTAGSAPAVRIAPGIAAALGRRGLPLLHEFPKPLTDEVVRASDVIVTMGCGDACPILPGRHYVDWNVEDPAGLTGPEIDAVIDNLEVKVRNLLDSFLSST